MSGPILKMCVFPRFVYIGGYSGQGEHLKRPILITFVSLILLTVGACAAPSPQQLTREATLVKRTHIAVIDGGDEIAAIHIDSLLAQHGIVAIVEGSVVYGVEVPADAAGRSSSLLAEDARRRPYFLRLSDGQSFKTRKSDWMVEHPGKRFDELVRSPSYAVGTDLGGALCEAHIQHLLRNSPYINAVHTLERHYLASGTGRWAVGHDINLELGRGKGDDTSGARIRLQAYDGGQHVRFQGSNAWMPSEDKKPSASDTAAD